MKTKIITLASILILLSVNLKANTEGEVKKTNSARVEIVKDYIKNVIANEKIEYAKMQKEELIAMEAYISEQGDIMVENMNFSNYFWAESVKQKLEKINIHDATDISGERFVLKFKYYQK
jgi:hypothetical protein